MYMYPTDLLVEMFKNAEIEKPFILYMFDPYRDIYDRRAIVKHIAEAARLADRFTVVNWLDRQPVVRLRPRQDPTALVGLER